MGCKKKDNRLPPSPPQKKMCQKWEGFEIWGMLEFRNKKQGEEKMLCREAQGRSNMLLQSH